MTRTAASPRALPSAHAHALQLSEALEAVDFRGWDPYDALSSLGLRFLARGRIGRQGAIQLLKRSPVNLRPLLGVPQRRHTKALALLVSAYSRLAQLPEGERFETVALSLAEDLADRLLIRRPGLVGWGYDFDVQTRWGFYPAGRPNAVVTAFALSALRDASPLPGASDRLLAVGTRAANGVRKSFEMHDQPCFGYYSGAPAPIHNASVLLASAVAAWPETDMDVAASAARAIHYTVSKQAADGSWPYGEQRGLGWIDGYHTAYILVALERWVGVHDDSKADAALRRGLGFFVHRLFEPSGAPRATVDRAHPIDIHAASSAIWALTLLRDRSAEALPLARLVFEWTLAHMRRADGRYAFQLHSHYRNEIPYIRWSDAHMLLALATLATAEAKDGV